MKIMENMEDEEKVRNNENLKRYETSSIKRSMNGSNKMGVFLENKEELTK
jgi:hypothetical protein